MSDSRDDDLFKIEIGNLTRDELIEFMVETKWFAERPMVISPMKGEK